MDELVEVEFNTQSHSDSPLFLNETLSDLRLYPCDSESGYPMHFRCLFGAYSARSVFCFRSDSR